MVVSKIQKCGNENFENEPPNRPKCISNKDKSWININDEQS